MAHRLSNIFWQVGSTAVIGTNAQFNGVILSKAAINMQTGASTNGNLLAQTDVTLDTNIVNWSLAKAAKTSRVQAI